MPLPEENEKQMSVEEYFKFDEADQNNKWEFFDGKVIAMAGASREHSKIQSNFIRELENHIRKMKMDCDAHGSDIRVKAGLTESNNNYFYPDVSVFCDENIKEDKYKTYINPTLVIEILSESTKDKDRSKKWEAYRRIPTLKDYVLVDQEKKLVEVFSRSDEGRWKYIQIVEDEGLNQGSVFFWGLNLELTLDEIYYRVFYRNLRNSLTI